VKRSAGLLLFRRHPDLQVLLAHPGGPLYRHRDEWGIPKGEYDAIEDPLAAAEREFQEELGCAPPPGHRYDLGEVRLKSGKRVVAWAVEGDLDTRTCVSNTFFLLWHGRLQEFPEIDEARWFTAEEASLKMPERQRPFLERLVELLG